jgi:putative membrane protein
MSTGLNEMNSSKVLRKLIVALSIIIPVLVASLFGVKIDGIDLRFLPSIYAVINGVTALVLIAALIAIKKKKVNLHRSLVRFALTWSMLFLVLYLAYHMTSESTVYGDSNHNGELDILERSSMGMMAYVYYFLLITHILLSIAVIPLVLFSYLFALEGDFQKHKKFTRFAFPIWLYVAITGVLVYLFISPFYA